MEELYVIATDDSQPLEVRYDAVRAMQDYKKLPKWKVRVLQNAMKKQA